MHASMPNRYDPRAIALVGHEIRCSAGVPPAALAKVTTPVWVVIGGQPAPVQYAGLTPGYAGLYQVNVQIPSGVTPGASVPLVITQDGVPSNTVTLAVR
jgi:uncharacterized protein (TIGR03437 family)